MTPHIDKIVDPVSQFQCQGKHKEHVKRSRHSYMSAAQILL